jgi:flagella basal body P-ring formation protein FlgA
MDIQVLNEIANLARQASLSKVSASVSANAQLKGLKGNPVLAPGSPVPPSVEGSPEQITVPVTPEISTVARAASAYSATVGDGLNSDELIAIQDLAGEVRTAVYDFLSQLGLEQAENAAAVVASNPEAVQDFTSSVKQAVVNTLNLPKSEVVVHAASPNVNVPEEVTIPEDFISLERITNGAEFNSQAPVVAASPALQNAQAGDHARVETPVSRPETVASPQQEPVSRPETVPANPQETPVIPVSPARVHSRAGGNTSVENPVAVEEGVETSSRDFRVTPASPAVQNANAQSRVVEDSANSVIAPEAFNGDFTLTAASPALQNAQAGDHARVETPVSRPDAIASPQQESVSRPETVPASPQEVPVTAASPALQNALAGDHARVETPVSRPEAVASPQQESVSRPETVPTNRQEVPVTAASPALQNAQAQNAAVRNPNSNPAPAVNQGQRPEVAQPVHSEGIDASPAGASSPQVSEQPNAQVSGQSNPQPASAPRPAQSSDLFAQENAAVKPENIRNVDELVNSVVDSEFTSEAKKIFSEPKVIRTVADLADFLLERLREIIATQQQQSQSSGEFGLS